MSLKESKSSTADLFLKHYGWVCLLLIRAQSCKGHFLLLFVDGCGKSRLCLFWRRCATLTLLESNPVWLKVDFLVFASTPKQAKQAYLRETISLLLNKSRFGIDAFETWREALNLLSISLNLLCLCFQDSNGNRGCKCTSVQQQIMISIECYR